MLSSIGPRRKEVAEFIKVLGSVSTVVMIRCTRLLTKLQFEKWLNLAQCIHVRPKRIRLFIKPYCGWCHKAQYWLDRNGVGYETIDVLADEAAYDEMIRLSGQDLTPVLEVEGDILADFGPDQLAEFWRQRGNHIPRVESA